MAVLTGSASPTHERILGALDKLPPFSTVLNRVLASLADDDVPLGHIAGIIETDTVLAGNVLRVVNSPLFGWRCTINSVRHAVALMGTVKIRNLVLGLSVSRKWAGARFPKRWSARRFNLHSLAVAVLADQMAIARPVPYPEGAFVSGLLHDVGKLLIAIAAPDELDRIYTACGQGGVKLADCEREILGMTHPEISAMVLERWNLPIPIREAALYHHDPARADEGRLHLSHAVQAADRYVNQSGTGMDPYVDTPSEEADQALRKYDLIDNLDPIVANFKTEFEAISSVM
jgi:HD-like signal output (HDOD) protein